MSDMAPSQVTTGSSAPPGLAADVGMTPLGKILLLSTDSPNDHGQNSATNRSVLLAWHGVKQLLKRVERCLGGTSFKIPVNVLNSLIEIGQVCSHLTELYAMANEGCRPWWTTGML